MNLNSSLSAAAVVAEHIGRFGLSFSKSASILNRRQAIGASVAAEIPPGCSSSSGAPANERGLETHQRGLRKDEKSRLVSVGRRVVSGNGRFALSAEYP
jgi:hypothetical protein